MANAIKTQVYDFLQNIPDKRTSVALIKVFEKVFPRVRTVSVTASTYTLADPTNEGKTTVVNRAAGSTITLPASQGLGATYRVVVGTALTSGSLIVQVANASDVMQGVLLTMSDDPATVKGWAAASTSDTITLNRTTTGIAGKGEWLEFEDVALNVWQVAGLTTSSGTEATPFSAAV